MGNLYLNFFVFTHFFLGIWFFILLFFGKYNYCQVNILSLFKSRSILNHSRNNKNRAKNSSNGMNQHIYLNKKNKIFQRIT